MTNLPNNSAPQPLPYSLENLQSLLTSSPAYAALPAEQKTSIQKSIAQNDKPVLLFIYKKLQEEDAVNAINREQLAKKVLQISPSDQAQIDHDLKNL